MNWREKYCESEQLINSMLTSELRERAAHQLDADVGAGDRVAVGDGVPGADAFMS